MEEFDEVTVEEASSLISLSLKNHLIKEIEYLNEALLVETTLFDARERLFKMGF